MNSGVEYKMTLYDDLNDLSSWVFDTNNPPVSGAYILKDAYKADPPVSGACMLADAYQTDLSEFGNGKVVNKDPKSMLVVNLHLDYDVPSMEPDYEPKRVTLISDRIQHTMDARLYDVITDFTQGKITLVFLILGDIHKTTIERQYTVRRQ